MYDFWSLWHTCARRQRNKTVNGRSRLSFDGHPHVRAAKVQLDQLFSLPSAEVCACVRLCRRAAAVAVAAQSLAQSPPLACCHLIGCCTQPVWLSSVGSLARALSLSLSPSAAAGFVLPLFSGILHYVYLFSQFVFVYYYSKMVAYLVVVVVIVLAACLSVYLLVIVRLFVCQHLGLLLPAPALPFLDSLFVSISLSLSLPFGISCK